MKDRRPIRQRLAEFYTETELDLWIYLPHPQLGDVPPRSINLLELKFSFAESRRKFTMTYQVVSLNQSRS